MIREHSDEQVLERARQIDAGRKAGLSSEQIIELVAARAQWHRDGQVPGHLVTPTLLTAANTDAAVAWDAVFTMALRRQLRKLSGHGPNVST